jgi:hypothetical protein
MTEGATFDKPEEARGYAFVNNLDFNNQDDYCEICVAYHVGIDHDQAVPDQCGEISLQGFNTILECKRAKGHPPDQHDNGTSSWSVQA